MVSATHSLPPHVKLYQSTFTRDADARKVTRRGRTQDELEPREMSDYRSAVDVAPIYRLELLSYRVVNPTYLTFKG
eukprot:3755450-Amphidinium_carterae.1